MERMKEFILSPEEIYYIGKVSGGKYLDYDYIAAMKDIGKRGKIKQQEILDSLERKGYAQEDFLGNLEVEPLNLIPVFIHDFLCVHPFTAGYGRKSRLLTPLLRSRSGF